MKLEPKSKKERTKTSHIILNICYNPLNKNAPGKISIQSSSVIKFNLNMSQSLQPGLFKSGCRLVYIEAVHVFSHVHTHGVLYAHRMQGSAPCVANFIPQ